MSTKQRLSQSEQLLEVLLTSRPVKAQLKSERVQDTGRIQRGLQDVPEWQLGDDWLAIHRVKEFANLAQASAFASYVGNLASAMRQPVTIALAGRVVGVTLAGHPVVGCAGGLNKTVFRLAASIG